MDELAGQNSRVALTEASQRRLFYETQLVKEKDALADAEVALRDTQQSTGLVAPTGQAEGLIRAVSQLHAEILSREAQIEAMRTYAADTNPRFQMVKREVSALQSELDKLERGNHVPGTPEVAAGQLPEAGLQYLRKFRDVKYHETLFEILAKQYEAARLDEAKSAPLVQVIDRAIAPERKSWPPRAILTIAAALLAACISSLWALFRERTTTVLSHEFPQLVTREHCRAYRFTAFRLRRAFADGSLFSTGAETDRIWLAFFRTGRGAVFRSDHRLRI